MRDLNALKVPIAFFQIDPYAVASIPKALVRVPMTAIDITTTYNVENRPKTADDVLLSSERVPRGAESRRLSLSPNHCIHPWQAKQNLSRGLSVLSEAGTLCNEEMPNKSSKMNLSSELRFFYIEKISNMISLT